MRRSLDISGRLPQCLCSPFDIDLYSSSLPEVWGSDADVWNPDRFLHIKTENQPANVGVFSNL